MRWTVLNVSVALLMGPAAASGQTAPKADIDHVAIHVANLERSSAFYRDVFGMEPIRDPTPTVRWLRAGSRDLHLIAGRATQVSSPNQVHLALRSADLTATIQLLDARKIAWSGYDGTPRKIDKRFDGVSQIYLQDPDGYWIEVNDVAG